jgi:hypothetical protein
LKKKLKALLLLLACTILIGATSYTPLKDQSYLITNGSMEVDNHSLDYSINTNDSSSYSKLWIESNLSATSEKLVEFAAVQGYKSVECRPVWNLEIFVVDMEVLNDANRFNDYIEIGMSDPIWALFDQVHSDSQRTSIILTDHGDYNSTLFAHELAHYWAYRFCWDFYHKEKSGEEIAVEFEKFYERSN